MQAAEKLTPIDVVKLLALSTLLSIGVMMKVPTVSQHDKTLNITDYRGPVSWKNKDSLHVEQPSYKLIKISLNNSASI